jgi:hypothetical protein
MTNEVKKLKRAKGSLLRAIRSGIMQAPPGYMTFADYEREERERNEKRTAKQHINGGTPNVQVH